LGGAAAGRRRGAYKDVLAAFRKTDTSWPAPTNADFLTGTKKAARGQPFFLVLGKAIDYSMILPTTPAPTVRPPSRIAKRRPSSIAIGEISSTDS